jgi:hypothetical protein
MTRGGVPEEQELLALGDGGGVSSQALDGASSAGRFPGRLGEVHSRSAHAAAAPPADCRANGQMDMEGRSEMASIACVGERGGQFDDLDVEGSRWHPAHRAGKLDVPTMAILCAVSVVQGLDNQLLASSFAALERLHGYEPAVLGSLVMGQVHTASPHTHTHTHKHTHTHTHTHKHTYTHTHTCTHTHVCVCVRACVCVFSARLLARVLS